MTSKKNALLSDDRGEAQIPDFCTTLTCTGFLVNGMEEHLQLSEEEVRRWRNGEEFAIALPLPRDIVSGTVSAKYHFLRASFICRLYVHEEMRGEADV